jgi:hypothetical protein
MPSRNTRYARSQGHSDYKHMMRTSTQNFKKKLGRAIDTTTRKRRQIVKVKTESEQPTIKQPRNNTSKMEPRKWTA